MITEKNKFGEGNLYQANDLRGNLYAVCTACMSIQAEFLSWANKNKERFKTDPHFANSIIVLSCQVTDLAVLNDLKHLYKLMKLYPERDFYVGGCLARRFDIPLPEKVKRLDIVKHDHVMIHEKWMVDYAPPFWVKDYSENGDEKEDGHLFRNMYPLRIGAGCTGKCKYCTIRTTRGSHYTLDPNIDEFLSFDNILLIADSPSSEQIIKWCSVAKEYQKSISIRNLEPFQALKAWPFIKDLSDNKLLEILHVPIQSPDVAVLEDMNRPLAATLSFIENVQEIKNNTYLATNIIIDYRNFMNPNMKKLKEKFDYVSWNPYWNGLWDKKLAEKRFCKYFR